MKNENSGPYAEYLGIEKIETANFRKKKRKITEVDTTLFGPSRQEYLDSEHLTRTAHWREVNEIKREIASRAISQRQHYYGEFSSP